MLKFAWLYKNLCLGKSFLIKERILLAEIIFIYRKFIRSTKILLQEAFLFVENFDDYEKFPYCRKVLLPWLKLLKLLKFLGCWKFPELWKVYKDKFITENLLSWLQKKIIVLLVLKTSASVETIKAYILRLKQKLAFLC